MGQFHNGCHKVTILFSSSVDTSEIKKAVEINIMQGSVSATGSGTAVLLSVIYGIFHAFL
jgi:hypothetical protein